MVFPDPLTSTGQISAASFVYFDAPIVVPTPVWIPNDEAFGLNELILDRRPDWGLNYFRIDEIYGAQISAYQETMRLLKPLEDGFLRTLLAFDADTAARQEGLDFLESTGETVESVLPMLDVHAAAGEVFHHVLIDEYAANEGD